MPNKQVQHTEQLLVGCSGWSQPVVCYWHWLALGLTKSSCYCVQTYWAVKKEFWVVLTNKGDKQIKSRH